MRKLILAVVVGVVVSLMQAAATPPTQAANGSFMLASKYYTTLGMKMALTGSAYQYNYGCGIKDCDKVSQVYAYVGRTGGEVKGNLARVRVSTTFTGAEMGFSVGGSLSGPSGSVSVTKLSNGCGMESWWESRSGKRQVSVDWGDGKFCEASTFAWICSVKLTASGAIRIGDNWYPESATDKRDIGC